MEEHKASEGHATDILIIGSGAAGLTLALRTADFARVTVLSKGDLQEGATFYAQGGIAAVLDDSDSVDSHVQDTLKAGVGLCHKNVVEHVVANSARAVNWLVDQGVPFTTRDAVEADPPSAALVADLTSLHLTQEGGHSHRRIIHATDATGKAVFQTLQKRAQEHPNISLLEGCTAVDLVTQTAPESSGRTCVGVYVLNQVSNKVEVIRSRFVTLATGGASKAYLYTSNPDGASGDGIAMAWRAGCRVANMEFNQFHPTCLYHPHAGSFLVSEAVRGEGGFLRLSNGDRFMQRFDQRGDLAPRDIVARAIDHEMKRTGAECVYLDISHRSRDFIYSHFPNIAERCQELGIDITKVPIPVVPAAHYTCGGVVVDEEGRTDLANLYAIGEVSCTGLHGANRLASNSLLECFAYAKKAADKIISQLDRPFDVPYIPRWDESQVTDSDESVLIAHNWEELRRFMWDFVGIVRTNKRLQRAQHRINLLRQEINEYYTNYRVTNDLIELRNLLHVADLIVQSAMKRQESRGLHF
ncbi:MAG TPA: L-aspartate oxidase, partial [Gammaproteobacteria bacterium]|nr:L-aspartate oxidase [Gammaproteobacteria bacterium]